jgi:hypothetical protein
LEVVDVNLIRFLWGSDEVEFSFQPLVGASGGIITMWDPRVVRVLSSMSLSHALIITGIFVKENINFCLANVYAPCDYMGRSVLWNNLESKILHFSQAAWCVLGDFNVVRSADERVSRASHSVSDEFVAFNNFIDSTLLIDLPLCGRKFTWYRGDGKSMSRLDRF